MGTYWKLVEVTGQPVSVAEGERAPHLQMNTQGRRFQGYGGVNQFFGTFENGPGVLKFGPAGATRRAGPPAAMATEAAFMKALAETTGYRVSPRTLELLAGDRVVARFDEDNRR